MEYKTFYYTEGNVVRKQEQAVPAYEPQKQPEERKRKVPAARPVRRPVASQAVPCLLIAAATMLAVCVCMNFLQVRAEVLEHKLRVEALEAELQTLRQDNDIMQSRLDTVANLDSVYETATKTLGMVYPSTDRLIGYDSVESEYVRQYEEIPGE